MVHVWELRDHLAEARRIMEEKAGAGNFDWERTAAGQLLLGLEAFFGPRPREGDPGPDCGTKRAAAMNTDEE